MEFSDFCFILTDDCNFNCSYCFQTRTNKYLDKASIKKAVDFFYPYFKPETSIIFFGGEPLLAFDKIQYTLSLLKEKNTLGLGEKTFKYFLTTNGSLATPEILKFFDDNCFDVMLSFDGINQDRAREAGSLEDTRKLLADLARSPNLTYSTNTVFDTGSISTFTESLRFAIESGTKEALISLDSYKPWDQEALQTLELQYEKLTDYLIEYYKEHRHIPIRYFRPGELKHEPGRFFVCGAGRSRMSITPDEKIWGCFLFHDYSMNRKENDDYGAYSFGSLDHFIQNHETLYPEIMENYNDLRQDRFMAGDKFCFTCEELEYCHACPVNAAYATDMVGKFEPQMCKLNKLKRNAKESFLEKLEKVEKKPI